MTLNVNSKIFTHLWFVGVAEQAARFYASIFPDSHVDAVTPLQVEPPGSAVLVDFTLFGQRFQALSAGPHHQFNDAISLVVLCDDQAELDRYWEALLADGGREQACGWLTDRFGVRWQIVPRIIDDLIRTGEPAANKRMADALLEMVKLNIAALRAAYDG